MFSKIKNKLWGSSEDCNLRLKNEALLTSGFASDLKIIVVQPDKAEEEIRAHKKFLQAGSAFLNSEIGKSGDRLVIENVESEIVKMMLKYLYTGAFEIGKKLLSALKLLQLATKYGIKDLVEKCEGGLEKWIILDTEALSDLEVAMAYGHKPMIERIMKFICKNRFSILNRNKFSNLSLQCLIEIIKKDELEVRREVEVFEAIYRWGKAECARQSLDANDTSKMRIILAKVLPHVRFPLMEVKYFVEEILPKYILNDNEVLELMTFIVKPDYEKKSSCSVGRFIATPRTPFLTAPDILLRFLMILMLILFWIIVSIDKTQGKC